MSLDDDHDTLKIYRGIIESAGYDFVGTTDEAEAVAILRGRSVDVFTQDVMRPGGMGGVKFLLMMKSQKALRRIPVVMISAQTRQTSAGQLKRAGLTINRDLAGYFQKPFILSDFLASVRGILGQY